MKGSFVEPCRSLSPYLWIQVCREKYLQGTRGACLCGAWIKATNVKKPKDDLAGSKDKNRWMKRKAPSREWGKEVRKGWSDNPPVPASITSNHLSDGGLDSDTQLNQEGKGYTEIKICISQQKRWNSHANNTHPTILLPHRRKTPYDLELLSTGLMTAFFFRPFQMRMNAKNTFAP